MAIVTAPPAYLHLEVGVGKAIGLMARASQCGASLAIFLDLWLPGYPWPLWLSDPHWGMTFIKRNVSEIVALNAEPLARLCEAAHHLA